jgi:hypothetical protein
MMSPDELAERLDRAAKAVAAIERRQDAFYVEWTLLQNDMATLNRKLEAFAKAVPGVLRGDDVEEAA